MAGAAVLALLMNSPQVKAEDEVVIFGGEFEDEVSKPAPKKVKEPAPIKELPPEENPAPVEKPEPPKPEVVEPLDETPLQPLETEEPAQIEPEENYSVTQLEDEDDLGDKLIFDDLSKPPEQEPLEQEPLEQPTEKLPREIEEPFSQPVERPFEIEEPIVYPVDEPFQQMEYEQPTEISSEWQERVEEPVVIVTPEPTIEERPARRTLRQTQRQQELKMLQPRFIKLAVDDTYVYYLDKEAIAWKKLPYSTSEYMADVWIRMIEREPKALDDDMAAYGANNFRAQIELAREQGYEYQPEDIKVLSHQAYILEHYYLRPKTRQVQFLCELEVFGRPQNTINERTYDARNWENLVPGSVESTIYEAAIKILGKSKASERGHMTFIDMLEEYGRISLR